jgi:outer membrane protein insertion porin family
MVASSAGAQLLQPISAVTVSAVDIRYVGPRSVSDAFIRANIRVKPGDPYRPVAVDDDIQNLYGTGLFYNIRVAEAFTNGAVQLTYVVQAKPRLTEIEFNGNKEYSDAKLRKKISSKKGERWMN